MPEGATPDRRSVTAQATYCNSFLLIHAKGTGATLLPFQHETKHYDYMRKIMKRISGCACVTSIVLAGCETPDGGISLPWTLGFIALALLSAFAYKKLEGAK